MAQIIGLIHFKKTYYLISIINGARVLLKKAKKINY